jgi:hypothetical protein
MVDSANRQQGQPQARQRPWQRVLPKPGKRDVARHGGGVLGALVGGMLKSLAAKLILAAAVALLAYFGIVSRVIHLSSPVSLTKPHQTITVSAVVEKLSAIEQLHVATAPYHVKVNIAQSVGFIPCWIICNQMQLVGTGTDDVIVDLAALSPGNVEVNAAQSSVTLWLRPPAIGPAILDPATCCDIASSHGVVNSLTQGLRNNPNGYRPLFVQGEAQIHDQAVHDPKLLAAGEQSTRATLAQILGTIGVKQVTVNFV